MFLQVFCLLLLAGDVDTLLLGGLGSAGLALLDEPLDLAGVVSLFGLTVLHDLGDLGVAHVTLALHALRGDQALDLGGLRGLAFTDAADDVLAHIVFLGEAEQLADLGGTLRSQTASGGLVGEAGDVSVTLLDDGELHDGEVMVGDGTANGLALAGARAALTEGLHALLEEQADAVGGEDTLHHGETLLVIATGDAEDVTLEGRAQKRAVHFGAHALTHEGLDDTVGLLIDDLDLPRGGVGD